MAPTAGTTWASAPAREDVDVAAAAALPAELVTLVTKPLARLEALDAIELATLLRELAMDEADGPPAEIALEAADFADDTSEDA